MTRKHLFIISLYIFSASCWENPNNNLNTRESETGLLTSNEAIQLARQTCKRVENVKSIINNPIAKLLGLSKLIEDAKLPLPRNALDPIGFIAWANRQGLKLQEILGRIGKMINMKRDNSFLSVEDLLHLLEYPCNQLDLTQSILDNKFIKWLHIGNWTLPLVDYSADKVNLLALPKVWLKNVFNIG